VVLVLVVLVPVVLDSLPPGPVSPWLIGPWCGALCGQLPGELEGPDGLLSRWWFPGEYQSGDGQSGVTQRLKGYIELLRKTV
jgi:hypothetical protein